tara:strand:- start:784 stop:1017 length:234 start_codon:yes stop_codon:yes gene_type:complete
VTENEISKVISMLKYAADQLIEANSQLQSGRNDGWVREYYRETIIKLQEDLCIQLGKIPLGDGDKPEQLNMFGTEND